MIKKIASATALGGVLVAGAAGVASASSSTASGTTPSAHRSFTCAMAPKADAKIAKVDAKISNRLNTLKIAESKATSAGETALATRIEHRIAHVESISTRVSNIQSRIDAKCGMSSSTTTTPAA